MGIINKKKKRMLVAENPSLAAMFLSFPVDIEPHLLSSSSSVSFFESSDIENNIEHKRGYQSDGNEEKLHYEIDKGYQSV